MDHVSLHDVTLGIRTADVLQCRPGRELGGWVESVAKRTKLPVSEVVRRLLVLMQCNFTMRGLAQPYRF